MSEFSFTINLGAPEPLNPQSIYLLAQGFYLAGNRCALNIEVGPGVTQTLVSPAVVNYCFSLELFCKALIQATGVKPRPVHKLEELFREIPVSARLAIEADYNLRIPDPNFAQLVTQASNYFQQVRYQYEYNVAEFLDGPLGILANIMYVYCSKQFGIATGIDRIRT